MFAPIITEEGYFNIISFSLEGYVPLIYSLTYSTQREIILRNQSYNSDNSD
jgi:hypothetical protein